MNPDLFKIRESRLFKELPERAFERLSPYLKVRAFERGSEVLKFGQSNKNYFSRHFGYVIRGRVLFLGDQDRPLGLAVKDEFFLGRSFSIDHQPVLRMVAAHPETLVVFIPKEIMELLAQASEDFSDLLEEIYDSVFERARLIIKDAKGKKEVEAWLNAQDRSKTLAHWVSDLEKKREQARARQRREKKNQRVKKQLWLAAALLIAGVSYESLNRYIEEPFGFSFLLGWAADEFQPGSAYNIALGAVGYFFLALTALHGIVKWGIRKWKWKINYQVSTHLHMSCGLVGAAFIFFHMAFHWQGGNIAHYALYFLGGSVISGLIGQMISNQIPKTIRGEQLKLKELSEEQKKLKQKAEMFMDENQYKTSVAMLAPTTPRSFWIEILKAPLYWWRSRKVKQALNALGLGSEMARVGASLVLQQNRLQRRVKTLEVANVFFKRWMWIHKPVGYFVYVLGAVHIILVLFLT